MKPTFQTGQHGRIIAFTLLLSALATQASCASATQVRENPELETKIKGDWYVVEGKSIVKWSFGADKSLSFEGANPLISEYLGNNGGPFPKCTSWKWDIGTGIVSEEPQQASFHLQCGRGSDQAIIYPMRFIEASEPPQYYGMAREYPKAFQSFELTDNRQGWSNKQIFAYSRVKAEAHSLVSKVKAENENIRKIFANYDGDYIAFHDSQALSERKMFQKLITALSNNKSLSSTTDCKFFRVSIRSFSIGCYFSKDQSDYLTTFFLDKIRFRFLNKADGKRGSFSSDSNTELFEKLCESPSSMSSQSSTFDKPFILKNCSKFSGKFEFVRKGRALDYGIDFETHGMPLVIEVILKDIRIEN